MKTIIVSDIHGGYDNLLKMLENEKEFDLLLILGDILFGYGYGDYKGVASILNSINTKIIAVRGNCDNMHLDLLDFNYDNPYILTSIDNRLIFMTHGHLYNTHNIPTSNFDVYIQGHTHIPKMEIIDGKLYLNPGSLSFPRGMSKKSYIVYQNEVFYLKELDINKVIKKCVF